MISHYSVIKWKHFRVIGYLLTGDRWIPLSKARDGALIFSLIWAWTKDWANNRDAGDLRRQRVHYDVTVITTTYLFKFNAIHWHHMSVMVFQIISFYFQQHLWANKNILSKFRRRWVSLTKGQWYWNRFHIMASTWGNMAGIVQFGYLLFKGVACMPVMCFYM